MPYQTIQQLPANVRDLPLHAQEIYLASFNQAYQTYADPHKRRGQQTRETIAHRVAWHAVKTQYQKNGKWHRKPRR